MIISSFVASVFVLCCFNTDISTAQTISRVSKVWLSILQTFP